FQGEGAPAFSFGVAAQGGSITALTPAGSAAAGLLDGGFETTALTSGEGNEGAICGMILSFEQNVTLAINGRSSLATLTVESTISDGGSVGLSYVNGLVGGGQPVRNAVTWRGETEAPTLGRASYAVAADTSAPAAPAGLAATAGDATVSLDWDDSDGAAGYSVYRNGDLLAEGVADSAYTDDTAENGNTYVYAVTASDSCGNASGRSGAAEATPEAPVVDVRGDSNGDLEVNISDPTFTLQWLFLGGGAPSCLATADANGDGEVNISDPTYTLRFLFLGGADHPELNGCDL
ncbi:MAG: hypothetical protein MK133_13845, partial [Planctomycetes bacterium]|nr:hypothetical protein [Planctomycetota bacterium]